MKYYIELRVWEQILKFLKQIKGIHTEDEASVRTFIEAIWFIVRSGCQWRLLPNCYGNWRAVHRRFKRWVDFGIWEQLMQYVQESPDLEATMLDIVKPIELGDTNFVSYLRKQVSRFPPLLRMTTYNRYVLCHLILWT